MTCLFLTLAIREMYKCVKFFSSPSGNRTLFFVFCWWLDVIKDIRTAMAFEFDARDRG